MSNSLKTKRSTRLEHTENKKGFLSTYEKSPDFICSAPGRIELLGNHVDYNGGSVMGIGINRYVTTGIGATSDEREIKLGAIISWVYWMKLSNWAFLPLTDLKCIFLQRFPRERD
jgi:hypothetical protein